MWNHRTIALSPWNSFELNQIKFKFTNSESSYHLHLAREKGRLKPCLKHGGGSWSCASPDFKFAIRVAYALKEEILNKDMKYSHFLK